MGDIGFFQIAAQYSRKPSSQWTCVHCSSWLSYYCSICLLQLIVYDNKSVHINSSSYSECCGFTTIYCGATVLDQEGPCASWVADRWQPITRGSTVPDVSDNGQPSLLCQKIMPGDVHPEDNLCCPLHWCCSRWWWSRRMLIPVLTPLTDRKVSKIILPLIQRCKEEQYLYFIRCSFHTLHFPRSPGCSSLLIQKPRAQLPVQEDPRGVTQHNTQASHPRTAQVYSAPAESRIIAPIVYFSYLYTTIKQFISIPRLIQTLVPSPLCIAPCFN